jgi:hypothetical protein
VNAHSVFVCVAFLVAICGFINIAAERFRDRTPRATLDDFRNTCGRRCEISRRIE